MGSYTPSHLKTGPDDEIEKPARKAALRNVNLRDTFMSVDRHVSTQLKYKKVSRNPENLLTL